MAGPSHLNSPHSLHVFSIKSPSSSSPTALSTMKLKTIVHSYILSHLCRIARALTKAKSILIHLIKEIQLLNFIEPTKRQKNKTKLFFGSFRLHYNWCSSHVLPVPSPISHIYHDNTWNSIISPGCSDIEESQLSGYLHWLERKVQEDSKTEDMNEIDKLADMFIANCHEKFLLEKQESYRMFQEMMARSVWASWCLVLLACNVYWSWFVLCMLRGAICVSLHLMDLRFSCFLKSLNVPSVVYTWFYTCMFHFVSFNCYWDCYVLLWH